MAKSATKPQKLKKGDFKQKKTQAKNGKQKNIKGSKRKLVTSSDAPANKRRKVQNEQDVEYEELGAIDTWDWSEVATDSTMLSSDLGGFLCLEEIDDVQVEYEGDETSGKIVKFKVRQSESPSFIVLATMELIHFLFSFACSVSRKQTVRPQSLQRHMNHLVLRTVRNITTSTPLTKC